MRKAFLCGVDKETGVSFEHRRAWIEKRILKLAQVFAIDICAHAVMHNHLHLVLHVDSEQEKKWSVPEVLNRWHQLFKGTYLTRQYQNKQPLDKFQIAMVESSAEVYKKRLQFYNKFEIEIIPDLKKTKNLDENQQKEKEGELILSKVQNSDFLVLLDENGKEFSRIYKKFHQKFEWVRDQPWEENEAAFIKIVPFSKSLKIFNPSYKK